MSRNSSTEPPFHLDIGWSIEITKQPANISLEP